VLLYSMVSAQLSYNPHGSKLYMYDLQATTSFRVLTSHADAAYAGGAAIINAVPAKRERSHEEQGMYCMLDCPGESMELHHLLKNRCTCRGRGGRSAHETVNNWTPQRYATRPRQSLGFSVRDTTVLISEMSGSERDSDSNPRKETPKPKEKDDPVEFTEFGTR
jgi:hypothetical protein